MTTHAQKLAASLEILSSLVQNSNRTILKSGEITRTHKDRLVKSGFLVEILKGWYVVCDPAKRIGESTLWYANYWNFLSIFFQEKFGNNYCVSAEGSLLLHIATTTIPYQLTVIAKKTSTQTVKLPLNTSVFIYQDTKNIPEIRVIKKNLQIMTLPEAICRLPKSFYERCPIEAEIALALIQDPSQLLQILLKQGQTTTAGYLVGAYMHLGRHDIAANIKSAMIAAGHRIVTANPFVKPVSFLSKHISSPHAARLQAQWYNYRIPIINAFGQAPGLAKSAESYLLDVEEQYITDAYNSLSIEGYDVSPSLIDRIQKGGWDPVHNANDQDQKNALAAKGYRLAFEAVRESLKRILGGENPGSVVRSDLSTWYRALFTPSVQAGLLADYHLAGYRSHQVYIQNSRHIPFPQTALLDSMDVFFNLLEKEDNPAVRAILGHFFFVHIHPYGDGNGRIGRFLMNVMMASGGYPWTIIPVSRRSEYMQSLEKASCDGDITSFMTFVQEVLKDRD